MNYICTIPSPIGLLTLSSDGESITGLWIEGQKYFAATLEEHVKEQGLPVFKDARQWLDGYFSGAQPEFILPLAPKGSAFRQQVWQALCAIPYGKVSSYGEIAAKLGRPAASQAVGGAVAHNPISIFIPCHRVVGANGSLTGYAGGIDKKIWLLKLEKVALQGLFMPTKGTAL